MAEIGSVSDRVPASGIVLAWSRRAYHQFVHLYVIYVRRSVYHDIAALVVLRERYVITDCFLASEQGADPVETERKAPVRRCAELEGVHDETELVFRIFLAETENLEHPRLHLRVMNPYGTASELSTVQHEIVSIGADLLKVGFFIAVKFVEMRWFRSRERMVHRIEPSRFVIPFQQREVAHPKRGEVKRIASISIRSPSAAPIAPATFIRYSGAENLSTEDLTEPSSLSFM